MESFQEVKIQLMQTSEEFSRLAQEHLNYERQLEELSCRTYLTQAEQLLEVTLKKRKLSLKDQMERIIQEHRLHQHQGAVA